MRKILQGVALATMAACGMASAMAAPVISRLTPPSTLFSNNDPEPPYTSRFLPGQRFDLQATVRPDAGQTILSVKFLVDGSPLQQSVALAPATALPNVPGATVASLRAYSSMKLGPHTLSAVAVQSNNQTVTATGNFEIVGLEFLSGGVSDPSKAGTPPKNIIVFIGDGMGIAHRTAARIMTGNVRQGKAKYRLASDTFPFTGIVETHSLNSIITDSSPGASCYSTGNKGNNNQHGVFPDDTTANFDNPRVENIAEYLKRLKGRSLGIVTTSDVFDATPGAFASHTQARSAGTGICDQYLDESPNTDLRVLMGGGRKWFLPAGTPGSARTAATDYVLPDELATGWGIPKGASDPGRNLIADFQAQGFTYVANDTELGSVNGSTGKVLGLFALSNMNVALDKIAGRRGTSALVSDYGFPDQPMLDEMATKALDVLAQNPKGFVLMVEGASIDKQAHNMDTERWILDTIEFDRAIKVGKDFAAKNGDTLVVVTADHECAGVNIIAGSMVTDAELQARIATGEGAAKVRNGVVGTYDTAGFPHYQIAADGYPVTTDIDYRMIVGYAANADRYEDWRTNPQPLRDSQQPFNNVPPLSLYPNLPVDRDTAGRFLVTGQLPDTTAAHTASDIVVLAYGPGASRFTGFMDNTDVFFRMMAATLLGP